jgi:hypothetical protein
MTVLVPHANSVGARHVGAAAAVGDRPAHEAELGRVERARIEGDKPAVQTISWRCAHPAHDRCARWFASTCLARSSSVCSASSSAVPSALLVRWAASRRQAVSVSWATPCSSFGFGTPVDVPFYMAAEAPSTAGTLKPIRPWPRFRAREDAGSDESTGGVLTPLCAYN